MPTGDAGTAAYTSFSLKYIYDVVVALNSRFLWGCPFSTQLQLFTENFSENHLDVGAGTGHFPCGALDRLSPDGKVDGQYSLTLCDLSPDALVAAERRILTSHPRVAVKSLLADATAPLPMDPEAPKFQSVSMLNLMHCIPGPKSRKLSAFQTAASQMTDDGVLIGTTLVGSGVSVPWLTGVFLGFYNRVKAFSNLDDSPQMFEDALKAQFYEVETRIEGIVVVFKARKPRRG